MVPKSILAGFIALSTSLCNARLYTSADDIPNSNAYEYIIVGGKYSTDNEFNKVFDLFSLTRGCRWECRRKPSHRRQRNKGVASRSRTIVSTGELVKMTILTLSS